MGNICLIVDIEKDNVVVTRIPRSQVFELDDNEVDSPVTQKLSDVQCALLNAYESLLIEYPDQKSNLVHDLEVFTEDLKKEYIKEPSQSPPQYDERP